MTGDSMQALDLFLESFQQFRGAVPHHAVVIERAAAGCTFGRKLRVMVHLDADTGVLPEDGHLMTVPAGMEIKGVSFITERKGEDQWFSIVYHSQPAHPGLLHYGSDDPLIGGELCHDRSILTPILRVGKDKA
jgi:hypothetical protein